MEIYSWWHFCHLFFLLLPFELTNSRQSPRLTAMLLQEDFFRLWHEIEIKVGIGGSLGGLHSRLSQLPICWMPRDRNIILIRFYRVFSNCKFNRKLSPGLKLRKAFAGNPKAWLLKLPLSLHVPASRSCTVSASHLSHLSAWRREFICWCQKINEAHKMKL